MKLLALGSYLALCLSVVKVSSAQVEPSATRINLDGWTLTPVIDRQATGEVDVLGLLALRDPETAFGDNITVIWYTPDAESSGLWNSIAWSATPEWDAIEYLKDDLSIGDEHDAGWAAFTERGDPQPAAEPSAYRLGFLADDPLLESIEESPDRDALVVALDTLGFRVADIPIEFKSDLNTDEGRTDMVLEAIAFGVVAQEDFSNPAGVDAFSPAYQSKLQGSQIAGWFCLPISFEVPQPWGQWLPVGDWYLHSNSISDGGAAICIYRHKVQRTRQVIRYTVMLDCTVGVSGGHVDIQTYEEEAECQNDGGACPATPVCSMPVLVPGTPPPPGVTPTTTQED